MQQPTAPIDSSYVAYSLDLPHTCLSFAQTSVQYLALVLPSAILLASLAIFVVLIALQGVPTLLFTSKNRPVLPGFYSLVGWPAITLG